MLYTELTKKAMKIAFEAHKNQLDKGGLPYIYHPFYIAEQMDTEDEVCVALLHDVIEGSYITESYLREAGFGDRVIYALNAITYDKSTPYMDYINKIKASSYIARKVKIADLRHNSDITRLKTVTPEDEARVKKYRRAILTLSLDNSLVYGAIIGDIVGSKYEFNNIKTKEFPFLSPGCSYTDDTIMTIAVANALLKIKGDDYSKLPGYFVEEMQALGRRFPHPQGGYGGRFGNWIFSDNPQPYNSFGNGSAMRVSPCALYANTLDEAMELAEISASVTHNHLEGIKGAKAVAAAIFMAKEGKTKEEIKEYISQKFYPLSKSLDEIRKNYSFNETCQDTVPQAITAFLESTDFEDAIRNAVSLGGDSDTMAAITGSVAWAYYSENKFGKYDIPLDLELMLEIPEMLPCEFIKTLNDFEKRCEKRKKMVG